MTRSRVAVVVVAVVAGLMIALAVWLAVRPLPPGDASAEAGFARDMATHHAQAVEMSELVRGRTTNPEIHLLATDIALTQQAQIGRFHGWLDVWGLGATGREPSMAWMGHPLAPADRMPGLATAEELAQLTTLPPAAADVLFLQLMIRHHGSALDMGQAVLERRPRAEVARFAEVMVGAQRQEIDTMRALLARLDPSAAVPPVTPPEREPTPSHAH